VSQEEVLFKSAPCHSRRKAITPGIGFQVATPDAIRDKAARSSRISSGASRASAGRWSQGNVAGYAETWGKLMNIPTSVPLNWLTRGQDPDHPDR